MLNIEACESRQFNSSTFQGSFGYQKTLRAGVGCYIDMSRTYNGSWGQVDIVVPYDEEADSLLIFDPNFEPGTKFTLEDSYKEYKTGLVYSDNGWLDKRIFLANKDPINTVYVEYTFEGARKVAVALAAMVATAAVMVIS